MKDLRRNEFIDMLEMAEVLFEEKNNYISCDIPILGKVTYYPKADKLQINRNNKWEEGGFQFVKNILSNTTKSENPIQQATSLVKMKEERTESELRNDFAGLALNGIMLSGIANINNFDEIADYTFRLADAMVKRSKL